jgi:hypothetical protein
MSSDHSQMLHLKDSLKLRHVYHEMTEYMNDFQSVQYGKLNTVAVAQRRVKKLEGNAF